MTPTLCQGGRPDFAWHNVAPRFALWRWSGYFWGWFSTMYANGVQRLLGRNHFCSALALSFVASNARLNSHGKHEIAHRSPLQAVCWVPSESRQWPRIFHHWSFSIGNQCETLNQSRDRLINGNPSSAIFKYLHPHCSPDLGNQLRKPRIHGWSNYFDNKKYCRELSQHSDYRSYARTRARIFVGRFGGNGGRQAMAIGTKFLNTIILAICHHIA